MRSLSPMANSAHATHSEGLLAYNPRNTALCHPERQDTIFEANQRYSIPQWAVEAARLAYYRAEKSATERARLAEALTRVGFADLALFGRHDRDPRARYRPLQNEQRSV